MKTRPQFRIQTQTILPFFLNRGLFGSTFILSNICALMELTWCQESSERHGNKVCVQRELWKNVASSLSNLSGSISVCSMFLLAISAPNLSTRTQEMEAEA
ncbi:unnamed protein product [Rangifer tarandus platyrhynchus]|uniref:Uncharacterized protein n=1 Tax=Rangifer tarandus platyrhynchus TaxID=3082113 RepID=A0AC59ZTM2_RANTA